MKLLVTGGAGYIGTNLIVELLRLENVVHVVDNLCNSTPLALDAVQKITNKTVILHEFDIREETKLLNLMTEEKPDLVIHLCGLKSNSEALEKPLRYYQNNVSGTLNLLRAMDKADVKNLIFSSSATVYGNPSYLPIIEGHNIVPEGPYGRTKYFVEEIIKDWCAADRHKSAVFLRYFNPVGAHPSGEIGESPTGVPNNLMPYISQVAVGKRDFLSVFGQDYNTPDGTGVRDYIHVCDLAAGHVAAIDYCLKRQGVDVFNLGTGRGYSVLEIVKAFEKASGKTIPYKIMARRDGDVAECYADVSKAKELLNWEAKLDIDDVCRDAWRWQSQYPNGFEE